MPISAQASSSGGRRSSGSRDGSPVRYPPPYDVTTYIRDFVGHFDTTRFAKLPNAGTAFVVLYGPGVRDTAVGAWRRRWKHWGGRGASGSRAAFSEMDSPFVRCGEEKEYHGRLATLLADVRRRPEGPTVVPTDLFVLPGDLGRLYFLAGRAYWARELHFEALVRARQQLLAGSQKVELFSLRISDRPLCYCKVPAWWGQYDVPVLLFVPTPPVMSYYTGLALNASGDDRTRLWTIALTDYVLLAGAMFVVSAKNGACASYYTHNPRFDHMAGGLLFRLPVKIIDALKYFGLYKFAERMDTDPVLTTIAFHRCSEVDWDKTAVRDGFVSHDFRTMEVYGMEEESIPAAKRLRVEGGVSSSIVLPAVPLIFREGVKRVSLDDIRRDYSKYRGQDGGSGKASGGGDDEGLDLDKLLEKDLLWAEAGDSGDGSEETLVATRRLITAAGNEVPVSKKGYVELIQSFSTEVQAACRESQVASSELAVQMAKVEELELRVQLLTDAAEKAAGLQKTLSAKKHELASATSALETREVALKAKVRECDQLNYELGSARAAVGRGERVVRDFAERVRTGYTSSMRAQTGSYRDRLNPLLTDAQIAV